MTRYRLLLVGFLLLLWLGLPAIVAADDCSDWSLGEVVSCPPIYAASKLLGFLAGAMFAAAAGLLAASPKPASRPSDPHFPRHFDTWRDFNEWAEEVDYDGPPPPYLAPGGPPPVDLPPTPSGF